MSIFITSAYSSAVLGSYIKWIFSLVIFFKQQLSSVECYFCFSYCIFSSAIFSMQNISNPPPPRPLALLSLFLLIVVHLATIIMIIMIYGQFQRIILLLIVIQICFLHAGYKELGREFKLIRNQEIFSMNNGNNIESWSNGWLTCEMW